MAFDVADLWLMASHLVLFELVLQIPELGLLAQAGPLELRQVIGNRLLPFNLRQGSNGLLLAGTIHRLLLLILQHEVTHTQVHVEAFIKSA